MRFRAQYCFRNTPCWLCGNSWSDGQKQLLHILGAGNSREFLLDFIVEWVCYKTIAYYCTSDQLCCLEFSSAYYINWFTLWGSMHVVKLFTDFKVILQGLVLFLLPDKSINRKRLCLRFLYYKQCGLTKACGSWDTAELWVFYLSEVIIFFQVSFVWVLNLKNPSSFSHSVTGPRGVSSLPHQSSLSKS